MKYSVPAEANSKSGRTLADALDVLHQSINFTDNGQATVEIRLPRLPSRQSVGCIQDRYESLDWRYNLYHIAAGIGSV